MAATREQIMTALLAQLSTITAQSIPLVGLRAARPRSGKRPERSASGTFSDRAPRQLGSAGTEPAGEAHSDGVGAVYTDVGTDKNAIPMTQINYFIEAIEAALAPDMLALNRFTLGGLVFNCMLDGEGIRAAGDTTGKSVAAIPIKIILP